MSNYKDTSLVTSNFIFVPNTFSINKEYAKYINNISPLISFNISDSSRETNRINAIVRNSTNNRAGHIINNNIINMNTSLILISTIYFRSKWKHTFLPSNTINDVFYSTNMTRKRVNMMRALNQMFKYYEDDSHQILEMDYQNNELAMGIILTKNNNTDNMFISHEKYEFYISQLYPTKIKNVQIPKFNRQSRFKIDNLFKKMGMREIFTNADFPDITPSNNMMYISDINSSSNNCC